MTGPRVPKVPPVPLPPSAPAPVPARGPAHAAAAPSAQGSAPALIDSEQLFAGASEVRIDHRGALYRLKKTSLGKLILTK